MKIKLAFKFLPYLLIEKKLIERRAGQSKFFIVWVEPGYNDAVIKHEEVHIASWYLVTALASVLFSIVIPLWLAIILAISIKPIVSDIIGTKWKSFEESFAYARGAIYSGDPEDYLNRLDKSKSHKTLYGDNFPKRVRNRLKWFNFK